jgi:isoquinoline 1-oxidoreductase beta subunit
MIRGLWAVDVEKDKLTPGDTAMTRDERQSRGRKIARRTFLVGAAVMGGGLLVGAGTVAAQLSSIAAYRLPAGEGDVSFGAWLKFAQDGKIEVAVPHQEMGQGIYSLAVLLTAEVLRLPIDAVRPMQAPVHARFANPVVLLDGLPFDEHRSGLLQDGVVWTLDKIFRAIGISATGGSTSARNITEAIRACAATALDMLIRAAAEKFAVSEHELKVAEGRIFLPNGTGATYRELVNAAAKLSPRKIPLPPLAAGTYVGKGARRPDTLAKTNGSALFGIDAREPQQLYAAIRHSPRLGGVLRQATLPGPLPGIHGVVKGKNYVAVVAASYWTASTALQKMDIVWDDRQALSISTNDVFTAYRAALDQGTRYQPRWVFDQSGQPAASDRGKVAATYTAPFLAHATMEPLNATALVTESRVKVWAGHQSAYLARFLAARAAGVATDATEVVTPYLGGGFGRRADLNYIVKAVEIAREFKGTPVQTIWSRAEDIRDDFYRPAAMADVSAVLDADGLPSSLVYRIAVPSIMDQYYVRTLPFAKGGLLPDRSTVDGAAFPFYALPNRSIESFTVDLGIPVGFWRSVGNSLNNFFFETFIDELAAAAHANPIAYRARLLKPNGTEAAKRAQTILARLARFDADHQLGSRLGTRAGRGIALSECFHSFVGQLADVEVSGQEIRVKRVFAVVDCGFAIDPPNVVAQVRSAIIYGLSAALYSKVEIDNGMIVPENFDTYPVMTLADAPEIIVETLNSGSPIGGVGEIGTPGIAPAVGNAIFAATGERLRSLPFSLGRQVLGQSPRRGS